MNIVLLIPVKELTNAKTRLAGALSALEREDLAMVMLEGVLRETASISNSIGKLMVTGFEPAISLGRKFGFHILREERQESESISVDRASKMLEANGVTGVVRVPLDLPLIKKGEIERILVKAREGKNAVLVPSLQGTGTNAIYRSPPTIFPSQFGPGSLALHEKSARQTCKEWTILPLAGMALDIDEPDDLGELIARGVECPTLDFLKSRGIDQRLGDLS